jgi:predicted ATPase
LRDLGSHRLKDLGAPEHIFQVEAPGLDVDFPRLRSLDNPLVLNNLPAQPSSFIGRSHELSELKALVGRARLVTLTGAGGSGKTRLALQVAADLLDGSGDGAWLVELAAITDGQAVPQAIARALGIVSQPNRPALEALLDALSVQRVLVILDNCEHLVGTCATVAAAILGHCTGVHVVATSREPLGVSGENIYRVPSMSLPGPEDLPVLGGTDAVALFVDRARSQGVDVVLDEATGPLVASVCRRLDGMPLAIELAAARLRSLSLQSISERLDQRFRLLTGGSRNALARQQTLRATVDWSYTLLNGPEQSLLRRLSVFADGFDLDAAEAVCSLDDVEVPDVTDLVSSLVDKSLVMAEPSGPTLRYRLLETIRQYAAERLVEHSANEAEAVAGAHCLHFLSLAETAARHLTGPKPGRWLAVLDADRSNLRRAIEHAGEPGNEILAMRFAVALRNYWRARAGREEAVTLLLPVLEKAGAGTDPQLRARALVAVAGMAVVTDISTAQRLAEEAVKIARQVGTPALLARALAVLCGARYFSGGAEDGFPLGRESVEQARRLGDDLLLAQSLLSFILCSQVVDPVHVDELYREAIACAERAGDRYLVAGIHNNAGAFALRSGDVPVARRHLERAWQESQDIGVELPNPKIILGMLLRLDGDFDSSRSALEDALRMSARRGDRLGLAHTHIAFACLAADLAEWRRAAKLHGVAQALIDQIGRPWLDHFQKLRDDSMDKVRENLDEDAFRSFYEKGGRLSLEEATALALGRGEL